MTPIGLIERLIAAVTVPGDLVIEPAAGSFVVMHAARRLGRDFCGCDLVLPAVAARDGGILVSLCLQHNCAAETIAHALSRNSDGSASGVIGAVLNAVMQRR